MREEAVTAVDVDCRRERQLISLKRRHQMLGVREKRHSALKDQAKGEDDAFRWTRDKSGHGL